MAKANFILTLFGEMSKEKYRTEKGVRNEKTEKIITEKEIEREAEALEKEVSGRKDLDHITVSEDMEEALFQKIQDYEYEKRAKDCIS